MDLHISLDLDCWRFIAVFLSLRLMKPSHNVDIVQLRNTRLGRWQMLDCESFTIFVVLEIFNHLYREPITHVMYTKMGTRENPSLSSMNKIWIDSTGVP
jgi:hypothetical protein